jgi:serine/threonine protein kinase
MARTRKLNRVRISIHASGLATSCSCVPLICKGGVMPSDMAVESMMTQGNALGRYQFLHELGRGAMGPVYAARDRSTGAVVALKTLDTALLSKPGANFAEQFLKHARSARRLRHRNIVDIHDAGEAGGIAYVAMEILEGKSVRNMLDDGPLPIARAIQIAHDIACGLAYAHLEGVVHGGVNPSNVVVLRSGVVKITDFGLGQLGDAALLSGPRAACLRYLSPEQVQGGPVDHRCDMFSLGAVFYEMLTHRAPFEGDSPKAIMENILHAELPRPSELNQHVPRALDEIVSSMLARRPDDRLPGAPILLRELQRIEQGLGLGAADEPAASLAPPGREAELRTRDPNRFRDRARTQGVPRYAGQARGASGVRFRADSSADEEFSHRKRMPDSEAFDEHEAMFMMDREPEPERSSGSRRAIFAALALLLAVAAIGLTGFVYYWSGPSERRTAASRMLEGLATTPAPSRPAAPSLPAEAAKEPATPAAPGASPPRAGDAIAQQESPGIASAPSRPTAPPPAEATKESPTAPAAAEALPAQAAADARAEQEPSGIASPPNAMPPNPPAAEANPSAQTESSAPRTSKPPAAAANAPTQEPPRAKQPTAKAPQRQLGGTARLFIAIAPQGEIYIDGKHYGTTPPITTLDLEPGMHRIEVRSGSRKPYLTYMMVQAGEVRRIRHDFAAKPIALPR